MTNRENNDKSYQSYEKVIEAFLLAQSYVVMERRGNSTRGTYTYLCEKEDMRFLVKMSIEREGDKRTMGLRNEIAALSGLWTAFPVGETEAFLLPPGPEDIFEDEYEGCHVFGYARLYVDGRVLSYNLRDGTESFNNWVEPFTAIVKTIDTLPELDLPRTREKEKEDFPKVIVSNVQFWNELLLKHGGGNLDACLADVVSDITAYIESHTLVTGTVHGQLNPDHIVVSDLNEKPTLVSYSKLCQWYPRYWDAGTVYGWAQAVVSAGDAATAFYQSFADSVVDRKQGEFLKCVVNIGALGSMATVVDPDAEGGNLTVGCEAFLS